MVPVGDGNGLVKFVSEGSGILILKGGNGVLCLTGDTGGPDASPLLRIGVGSDSSTRD